jgi:tetratricopeptide (TPR) repeat protein
VWSAEGRPVEYARLCNSVADLYLLLADRTEPERYAQLALQMLDAAVKAQGREANAQSYAESQAGIGRAHYRLARTLDDTGRLRDAVAANEQAVAIYRSLGRTQELSTLQGTQGTIYLALSYHENRKDNVSKAVAAYREALDTMPPTATRDARGTTQINLGTAYYQLAQMSETEANGALALAAFEQARTEIRGDEANPLFEAAVARSEMVNKLLRETRYVFGEGGT